MALRGKSGTKTNFRGRLSGARRLQQCTSSAASVKLPEDTTKAAISWPCGSFVKPTTTTSRTLSCWAITASTSDGWTFAPPRMIRSELATHQGYETRVVERAEVTGIGPTFLECVA